MKYYILYTNIMIAVAFSLFFLPCANANDDSSSLDEAAQILQEQVREENVQAYVFTNLLCFCRQTENPSN